jgi:acyl carrier protein
METVERCRAIGVDEIGCLIDYGIDSATVLEHLPYLNQLRAAASAPRAELDADDYSIAAQLVRHRVTHLQCTPSMARMLVMNDEARAALAGLSHVMIGGEAFPGALAKELRDATKARITNMYGPTETTIWSSTQEAEPCEGTVAIGRPIANTSLYVLDESRQPVPVGVAGELYIGGDGVTRGYWERPELTESRFVPDPFAKREGARMYRTGDEVRWSEDGRIEFLGRIDHQVKIRGYRIELGEIESRLMAHPSVREAVVIAREDSPGDKRLVGYVIPSGAAFDVATLKAHLREGLPDFMVPSHFVRMDRFPLTPNKKIDRKALPRPDVKVERAPEEQVAPAGEVEEKVATVWKRILGLTQVSSHDNFFELGGHSLLAVQAHREIKEATGKELTVTDIFRFPTIASLAAHLEGDGAGSNASLKDSAERAAARRQAATAPSKRRVLKRR